MSDDVATMMPLRLSRAKPANQSAAFFEGFFAGAGLKMAHDANLRIAVDDWVVSLDEEEYTETLPLFRKVFSTLDRIERPTKSHLILITNLMEGGRRRRSDRASNGAKRRGVNVIVLLALTDTGQPYYDKDMAAKVYALGIPVFACTPDQVPDLMATALRREDI